MTDSGLPAVRKRFGWPEMLIITATALELAVALVAHHFPYTDPPNHLARYSLIARLWFGDPPSYVYMRWVPTPYIAGDVVGALFVHYLGAVAALRIMNIAKLVLLPAGMYALLLRSAPEQRGWALIGVLFNFVSQYLFGYLNYSLVVGLFFCWLALWYPRRESASWSSRIGLALGAMLLFLVHLSGPLLVLMVVWIDYGIAVIGDDVLLAPSQWRLANSRLATLLVVTGAVALVWLMAASTTWHETGPPGEFYFRTFRNKVVAFTSPFYSVSLAAAVVMAVGYGASLASMLYLRSRTFRFDTLTVSAIAMFILYLVFPRATPGTDAVDIRWLVVGYILIFCGRPRERPAREPRLALLIPFAACVVHTAMIFSTSRAIDRDLDHYAVALSHVPPRTTLLPLGDGVLMHGRVPVMNHFVFWHVINARGRAPGLFNFRNTSYQDPLYTYWAHFIEPEHLFLGDRNWGEEHNLTGLPWPRIDKEYDYLLQTSGGKRVESYLAQHADEVWHDDPFVLYKVRKAQ